MFLILHGYSKNRIKKTTLANRRCLSKRWIPFPLRERGITALEDVSFEVAPGEILGIIGPNGGREIGRAHV